MGSYSPITPIVLSAQGWLALQLQSVSTASQQFSSSVARKHWSILVQTCTQVKSLTGQWFEGLASNPWQNQSEENTLPDPKYSLYQGASTPQAQLELVLFEYASRVGVDVRVHHEFVGMSQDADGVTAVIKDHTASSMYTTRAQYLVAADGHRSAVRETLAIPRNGQGTVNSIQSVLFLAPEPKPFLQKGAKQFTIEQPGLKAFMIAYQDERLVLYLPNDHEYNDDIICELAHVIRGVSDAQLLATYNTERLPVAWLRHNQIFTHSDYNTLQKSAVNGNCSSENVALPDAAVSRPHTASTLMSECLVSLRLLLALALPFPNFPPWHLVPLEGSISYAELAFLADVPERALKSITRMATTNGLFIQMPPGHVSHLATSALLQTNSGFHNWAAFNCDISPPTAMAMVDVHEKWPDTLDTAHTAYNISTNSQRDTSLLNKEKNGTLLKVGFEHASGVAIKMEVYLFGDQTVHVQSHLQDLLHVSGNSTLTSFLSEGYLALRQEISHLPASERAVLPQAETLGLLLRSIKKGKRHPALEGALLCLYEIGEYIRLLQSTNLSHPPRQFLIGLRTGSLATATICCDKATVDLLPLGVEAVLVAFWVGLHASRRANALIASRPADLKPWTVVVPGLSESGAMDAIKGFLDTKSLTMPTGQSFPATMAPYISVVGVNSVTMSGPPDVMKAEAVRSLTIFNGRFREADGLDEFWSFWSLLQQGLDLHKPVPADRIYGQWSHAAEEKYQPHSTWMPDLQTWLRPALLTVTAYEAIEVAGLGPDRTPSTQWHRVGVYYSTTSDDWREVNSGQDVDTYFIPGRNQAFIPGRLNYCFRFSGPSISVDTACLSSLAAINVACTALLN
ncbi:hypothetical protein CDV55_108021 [Aspergillus turcosus]|nr:hypothetical protein CDV55_108021 [Aspergillus turcosus]